MDTAKDIMVTTFHTVRPDNSIAEAAGLFEKVSREEDRRIFGMIVTDDTDRLIGMISMYDVLLFVRPKTHSRVGIHGRRRYFEASWNTSARGLIPSWSKTL